MKPKRVLIVFGGWEGHEPAAVAEIFSERLVAEGFEVTSEGSLGAFDDASRLLEFDLISPCWTMGTLTGEQSTNLIEAVRSGVGLGGVHGGMGDAFRGNTDYEWMVGGHFVGHPHVGEYEVRVIQPDHQITQGLPASFNYKSEQYYMLVDPGISILADSTYRHEGKSCSMPVIWTKKWGKGRVFYSALGHQAKEFSDYPHVLDMTIQGMAWASR